jgi:hypothetical protein
MPDARLPAPHDALPSPVARDDLLGGPHTPVDTELVDVLERAMQLPEGDRLSLLDVVRTAVRRYGSGG